MSSLFSIELFKVPFDNSYKKVFDINDKKLALLGYGFEQVFHNYVLMNYEMTSILEPSISNIKRYNNNIIFTVKQNYFDIRNFNYISLKYNDKYYFYFITNIVSENDNPVNPSVTITGEWDAWHNHLTDLYFNKIVNKNTILKGHRNRYIDNQTIIPYNFIDNSLPVTKEQYTKLKHIAFLKVTFSKEFLNNLTVKYLIDTTNYVNIEENYLLPQRNGAYVYYIPIYLTDGEKIYNCNFVTKQYTCDYGLLSHTIEAQSVESIIFQDTNNYYGVNKHNFIIGGELSSYISKVEITFNSPFTYNITYENNNWICVINSPGGIITDYNKIFVKTDTGEMASPFLFFGVPKTNKNIGSTDVGLTKINNFIPNNNYNSTVTTPLQQHIILHTTQTNVYENEDIENEIVFYQYPFRYVTLYINDNEYIFNLPHTEYNSTEDDIFIIKVNNDNSECFIDLFYKDKKINNKPIFIKNSGVVSYSIDALDDYLIRNGSQEKTAVILNGISNIMSTIGAGLSGNIIGTIKSGVDAIGNPISIMSKHKDLNNTPSTMSNASNGEVDLFYQDRIVLYNNYIVDENIIKEIYQILYIYGYDYKIVEDILTNSRFWFDYKQTQNCKINNTINLNDKQRIEQMFDDGVHMFHINYDENNEKVIVNSSMEFNGKNNIERSIATI